MTWSLHSTSLKTLSYRSVVTFITQNRPNGNVDIDINVNNKITLVKGNVQVYKR